MVTATKSRRSPAQVEPEPVDDRRRVYGLAVVSDVALPSPLSGPNKTVNFKGVRLLTLEDNSKVHGCADCEEVTGTRGQVIKHRGEKHGLKLGRGDRRRPQPSLPDEVSALSVAELLAIARDAHTWANMFEAEKAKTTEWRSRCLIAEARVRQIVAALDRLGFLERAND